MSTRITDLPQAETLNGSEVMPLVQNGVTKHATLDFINQAAPAALILQQTQQAYANTVVLHDETEALKTEFEAQYLGSFPAPPVLNNDGSTLTVGAIYWNTSISSMYVWNGAEWTAFSSPSMRVHAQRFSGDGIQTDFLMTLGVSSASLVDVFINGIYQNKNTFTVEDTLISFSEPPPSGTENVEVLVAIATAIGETDASLVSYKVADESETVRNVQSKLRETVSVKDFGVLGNGTDETIKIQAALDAGLGPVTFPPGIYGVTSEIVVPDGSGIIGAGAHWKRRTGYAYDPAKQTVFKYIGAGGTNTCVLRFSNTAVGVQGLDFSGAETDDLINVTARDFHIDCNGLAEVGLYIYRAGNQATIGNATAEKAKKFNHVHLGCFAAEFGTFGAYESEEHGVACGWDLYGWTGGEFTNFAFRARYLTANNGTAGTHVVGSGTDLDGSGGKFSVGRGSEVFITSEANDGRACILGQPTVGGAAAGTTDYILEYVEGNGDGPYIDYRTGSDGIRIGQGFIHPGNGTTLLPQNIKIEGKSSGGVVTANSGPNDQEEWLVLYRMFGDLLGVGPAIDSNTYKYRMVECCRYFTFTDKRPGAFTFNLSLEGSTTPGTQSYTARMGYCTRVGNLVHVTGRITLSALDGTTAGQIRITGLPYRIANQSGYFGAVAIGPWDALSTPAIRLDGTLSGNTAYINLQIMTAASTGNLTGLARTDLSATSLIQFSATYITDES